MGSKHDPSLTWTKDRPALESRRVRTHPRTRTWVPGATVPRRMSRMLVTLMQSTFARCGAGRKPGRAARAHRARPPRACPEVWRERLVPHRFGALQARSALALPRSETRTKRSSWAPPAWSMPCNADCRGALSLTARPRLCRGVVETSGSELAHDSPEEGHETENA